MTATPRLRTAGEIHRYLVDQLNSALRRSGMYGGESAVRMLFDHLLYAEAQDAGAWGQQHREAVHSTYRAWASRDRTHQDVLGGADSGVRVPMHHFADTVSGR